MCPSTGKAAVAPGLRSQRLLRRSRLGERSVHGVREHAKSPRTQLAALFNLPRKGSEKLAKSRAIAVDPLISDRLLGSRYGGCHFNRKRYCTNLHNRFRQNLLPSSITVPHSIPGVFQRRAVSPIPEASAMLLLGTSLAWMVVWRRKQEG